MLAVPGVLGQNDSRDVEGKFSGLFAANVVADSDDIRADG
jgi:hypothetical protein